MSIQTIDIFFYHLQELTNQFHHTINVIVLIERVVPVTILAASICILSRRCFSYLEQLSQTTDEYSRIGRKKEI